jgi:hypothetical protein
VDAQLQVGRLGTIVEVKAEAMSLLTESTSVQGKIDSSVIESAPDLNHNPFYFATLLAGVVARNELTSSTNPYSFGVGIYSRDYMSAFSVNGSGAFSSDIAVDGVSMMGVQMNEALVVPNRDGTQEVRAITLFDQLTNEDLVAEPCAEGHRQRLENRRRGTHSSGLPSSHPRRLRRLTELPAQSGCWRTAGGSQGLATLV